MKMIIKLLLVPIMLLSILSAAFAQTAGTGPRFALLIGNSNYVELGKLKNPLNDASDIAESLKTLGFKVKLLKDADLGSMEDGVVWLGNNLSQSAQATGFFYYAGHGVQSGGTNYLIPCDSRIVSEAFLRTKALSTQAVLDTLQASKNALNIIVLDACRDNPFSWSRSSSRGLSVVGSQPTGSIVAYATSSGSVAQDGTGRNGVFTSALLKHLATPGVEIKEVFNRTGKDVSTITSGKQVPAVYSQFFDNAFLAGPPADAVGPSVTPTPVPEVAKKPRLTITPATRTYGSLIVLTKSAGTLFLDGIEIGGLADASSAKLDDVETGDRSVEIRYPDGNKERVQVIVTGNGIDKAEFSYTAKKEAPKIVSPSSRNWVVKLDDSFNTSASSKTWKDISATFGDGSMRFLGGALRLTRGHKHYGWAEAKISLGGYGFEIEYEAKGVDMGDPYDRGDITLLDGDKRELFMLQPENYRGWIRLYAFEHEPDGNVKTITICEAVYKEDDGRHTFIIRRVGNDFTVLVDGKVRCSGSYSGLAVRKQLEYIRMYGRGSGSGSGLDFSRFIAKALE